MLIKYFVPTALVLLATTAGCKAIAEGMAESYRADREERLERLAAEVTSCEGLEIVPPATRNSPNALGERTFTIPVRNNTTQGKLVRLRYVLKGQIAIHRTDEKHIAANDIATITLFKTRATSTNPFSRVIEFGGCR